MRALRSASRVSRSAIWFSCAVGRAAFGAPYQPVPCGPLGSAFCARAANGRAEAVMAQAIRVFTFISVVPFSGKNYAYLAGRQLRFHSQGLCQSRGRVTRSVNLAAAEKNYRDRIGGL